MACFAGSKTSQHVQKESACQARSQGKFREALEEKYIPFAVRSSRKDRKLFVGARRSGYVRDVTAARNARHKGLHLLVREEPLKGMRGATWGCPASKVLSRLMSWASIERRPLSAHVFLRQGCTVGVQLLPAA